MVINNLAIGIPESINIKRNHNDGTYNLYALMRSNHCKNNEKINTLIGLKSNNLKLNQDFTISSQIIIENNFEDVSNGYGATVLRYLKSSNRQFLYDLHFYKNADMLVEFQILNKGEEDMNYNIYENLESYIVQINVAGFTQDELDVILEDGIITVATKPNRSIDVDNNKCLNKTFDKHKSECEIYLPNIETLDAELKDGILYLTIPKLVKGKRIAIKRAMDDYVDMREN